MPEYGGIDPIQRLSEVRAYAKNREATVRHIQSVYQQKLRSGNVAAAGGYRKQALADLARTDGAFAARIGAERDRAAAAHETATGVAKQDLERVRAMATEARAASAAEAATTLDRAKDALATKVQTAAGDPPGAAG